jgi:hypothetical protein
MDDDWLGRLNLPLIEDGARSADLGGARVAATPGSMRALLRQAPSHQMTLLMPMHLSPKRLAALRAWIQACVKGISTVRSPANWSAGDAEAAQASEIATQLAAVADAFAMYASMLEKSRIANHAEPGLAPTPRPLAAVADDERLLLNCRVALRRSMQELIAAVAADN